MKFDAEKVVKKMPWLFLIIAGGIFLMTFILPPANADDVYHIIFLFVACACILFIANFIMSRKTKQLENRYANANPKYAKRK